MQTLKKNECSILYLTLKKEWYKLIWNGIKREEYRDATDYWKVRIGNFVERGAAKNLKLVVAFSLWRRKADLFMMMTGCKIFESSYHIEWGEPSGRHYAISLGERVNVV